MSDDIRLSDLLPVPPACDRPIAGLALDSRAVRPGYLFLACQGTREHGSRFIPDAVRAGAAAVLVESEGPAVGECAGVPCIPYPGLGGALGELAARFHGYPARDLQLIGVTGTNGKTSVSHFIAQVLPVPCGLLGTSGYGVYGALRKASHTTPDALRLHALFAELRGQGVRRVAMEVSSHALEQGRVAGLTFDTAVFTNLSRDHLDYHGTMAAYGRAKRRLFEMPGLARAVIDRDDAFGQALLAGLPAGLARVSYSLGDPRADVYCREIEAQAHGYRLEVVTPWGVGTLRSPLPGTFNIRNLLATLGVVVPLGVPFAEALARLGQVRAVAGRMERFTRPGKAAVIVDYAHTPDALEKVLLAAREHCRGRLWCVFGCGGGRDAGKRPQMGAVAERRADRVVLTDDNPRHEDSAAILAQIAQGMADPRRAVILAERPAAIRLALSQAAPEDVIVVAGKGAEDTQQIGDRLIPYSDRECVETVLADH